jgi:hypothetical protein
MFVLHLGKAGRDGGGALFSTVPAVHSLVMNLGLLCLGIFMCFTYIIKLLYCMPSIPWRIIFDTNLD